MTLPDAGSLITGRPQVWQETVAQSRNGSELTVQVLQETADRVKSADPGTTAFLIPLQADAATFDVHIPASVWQAVADKTGGAGVVVIQTPLGAYRVPVGAVDLGSGGKEVQVTVGRADSSAAPLQALLDQTGGTLAGGPVDFAVRRVDGGGSPAVVDYGGRYLRGLISLGQADAGPGDTGVFLYDANRGGWVPAPVRFLATAQGKEALVAQPAAGVYAVIRHPKTFDDLQGHWAGDQVAKMAAQGVIAGVDERHFAPDAPVTRGQFAVMLVRALGLETVRANRAPFADVPADAWDRHEIDVAVQEGLMSGIGDGRFADGDPMTREQMMAVLGRAMRIVGGSVPAADPGVLSRFADRSAVSDWAGGDVAVAVQTGVVVGSDGRLDPGRAASRAEAATMLGKMLAFLGLAD
ncbi:MAG: S-layer homology domain-containing protein [Kyrpidia sp.]|nr:S-layer homology domain-containing protein [Kyrpidia sp.]